MQYVYKANINRFLQIAQQLFDFKANSDNKESIILSAIEKYKQFLKTMSMPVTLRELGIPDKQHFAVMAQHCVKHMNSGTIGNFMRLSPADITQILDIAF